MRDGPQRPFRDDWPANRVGHGQDSLLNHGVESKQAQDLRHPGAGDSHLAGNGRLVRDLAGLKEGLPLKGLAEVLDDPRGPGYWGLAWARPGRAGSRPRPF